LRDHRTGSAGHQPVLQEEEPHGHSTYDLNPEQNILAGAFIVRRCSFERCLFHRIGFVTHADQREVFRTECVEEEAKE
jgi:hypothetical protein